MASTRKLIVADTWTEVLGAGALGIITVLRGTIVVNRSASIPATEDGQIIGDTSLDKVYEREAESDSALKLWAKAIGSSGKAEIVIDEGLNSTSGGSGGGATVDTSALATAAKQEALAAKLDSTNSALGAVKSAVVDTNGLADGAKNVLVWDANGNLKIKKYFVGGVFSYEIRYDWNANGNLISKERFNTETV